MIEVVNAVLVRDSRILLTQRRADQDAPHTWECPGGEVDGKHESHHDALKRELVKRVDVTPYTIGVNAVYCCEYVTPKVSSTFVLHYEVKNWLQPAIAVHPRLGQGLGWFTADEMVRLNLHPATRHAMRHILELTMDVVVMRRENAHTLLRLPGDVRRWVPT